MAKENEPRTGPPAAANKDAEIAALIQSLQQEVESLKRQVNAGGNTDPEVLTLLQQQREALSIALADRAEQIRQDKLSQDEVKKAREMSSKTCQQRTQEMADHQFRDGRQRWQVCIPRDPVQPALQINANSAEEARGRYQSICGIRATDWDIEAVTVQEAEARVREAVAAAVSPILKAKQGVMSLASLHGAE